MDTKRTKVKTPDDPAPIPGALLDPGAAASLLNCSTWTLAAYRCQGNGPKFMRLGNRIRYTPSALAEWIEANTAASTSEHDAKRR